MLELVAAVVVKNRGLTMRHPYRTVPLVLLTAALLTSCMVDTPFQLLLTVRNADDGQPVPGVKVTLGRRESPVDRERMDVGSPVGLTNADGRLTHDFKIGGYTGPKLYYLK